MVGGRGKTFINGDYIYIYIHRIGNELLMFRQERNYLPSIWLRTVRPSSPRQALRASKGFVNCTNA